MSTVTDDAPTLRIEARFKNARLYHAIHAQLTITATSPNGIGAQQAGPIKPFCDLYHLNLAAVYRLLNLRDGPLGRDRRLRPICQTLAGLLACDPAWLFPADLYQITWPRYLATDTDGQRFVSLIAVPKRALLTPPPQETEQVLRELRDQMRRSLRTLTPREELILKCRFGFDRDGEQTQREIADRFGISTWRVQQIEAKALRKLRHPARAKSLMAHLP